MSYINSTKIFNTFLRFSNWSAKKYAYFSFWWHLPVWQFVRTFMQHYPMSRTKTKWSCSLLPSAVFLEGQKNSFYGLLSSQLPCSRCSCRRCLLPPRRRKKNTHRDQLICTVINRKETFERSARQGVNPGMLLLNAPTWQGLLFD